MFEFIPIALLLPALSTSLVVGAVAWSAVRRARPEDVPRVLEICERMLRRSRFVGRTTLTNGTRGSQGTTVVGEEPSDTSAAEKDNAG
jgi:hypothetical protein